MDARDTSSSITVADGLLYLGPGVALLLSLRVWGPFSTDWLFGAKLAENQAVAVFVFAVLAYSCGLAIHEWCRYGSMKYMRIREPSAKPQGINGWRAVGPYLWWWGSRALFWLLWGMPLPVPDATIIEAELDMNDSIKAFANLRDSTHLQSPWDRLENYRLVASGRLEEKAAALLRRADREHQHLVFLVGMSFSSVLLALQAAVVCMLKLASGAWTPASSYPLVVLSGCLVSLALRRVAASAWKSELLLTCQLAMMD